MAEVDEYRERAEECRERAEKSWREDDKRMWLKLAEEWQRLVDQLEGP